MKALLTGNEAVARGAYEAGLIFASAYPGTPSTEILENLIQYKSDIYSEWAPNEKVAFEAAAGAAIAGARSLAAMKHVGVNVAADPLFTFAYTGTNGGFVLVSADDPGMHSSQNEQDNRNYAKFAKIPMLEPSDSQEAKDFTILALQISEQYDTPVLLRLTTRICHSKSVVELGDRTNVPVKGYTRNIGKYIAAPANARALRVKLEDRFIRLRDFSNATEINSVEYNDKETGVIGSGVAYQYAREVFGENASYLKLGCTYPLPMEKIKEFAQNVKTLYVIEELDPYIEEQLKAEGIACIGKELIPSIGELSPDIVRRAVFGGEEKLIQSEVKAVGRPPTLCAGCPHRGLFYVLSKKKNLMIAGDIGCYTLGSAEPLNAMDTCICMGASISAGHGAAKVFEKSNSNMKVVAVIGDSTFFHSGITSLMDIVYNKGNCTTIILDNRITGMTGHQENPGTGYTLMGEKAPIVNIPELCRAIGIKDENIFVVNPLDLKETDNAIKQAMDSDEPSVVITKWPCVLKRFSPEDKEEFDLSTKLCAVNEEKCKSCKLCLKTGCPAISFDKVSNINQDICTGCEVCLQVCPFHAIEKVGI
ncbi:MAG: indolepyruvate ferredoxin oxidoreductase subunit alpha [Clostridiales bacterium]|nr:indolepyruvate ferredoxin oxidoreductase subunit alpha [Clostridiales bacterium]